MWKRLHCNNTHTLLQHTTHPNKSKAVASAAVRRACCRHAARGEATAGKAHVSRGMSHNQLLFGKRPRDARCGAGRRRQAASEEVGVAVVVRLAQPGLEAKVPAPVSIPS